MDLNVVVSDGRPTVGTMKLIMTFHTGTLCEPKGV